MNHGAVVVDVTNAGAAPIRLVLNGETREQSWCLPLNGGGGFYAWEEFTEDYWAPGGTPYAGQPLAASTS